MIHVGEPELICDLAETYHIYDYRSLPIRTVGIFCIGLGEDSRIKTKLRGGERISNNRLLSMVFDRLNFLAWCRTEGAENGTNKPEPIHDILYPSFVPNKETVTFDSADDYNKARKRILERKEKRWQKE